MQKKTIQIKNNSFFSKLHFKLTMKFNYSFATDAMAAYKFINSFRTVLHIDCGMDRISINRIKNKIEYRKHKTRERQQMRKKGNKI